MAQLFEPDGILLPPLQHGRLPGGRISRKVLVPDLRLVAPASAFRAVRYACIWGVASGGIAASPGTGRGVKVGLLVHPTRLALTGAPSAPSLYHLIEVLGKIESLRRIDTALRVC